MSEIVLGVAALPAVTASAIWAIRRPDTFALVAVLSTMVIPLAIFRPGGAEVAIADVLLLVVAGAWLVAAAAGGASEPFIRGNPLFAPTCFWVIVNLSSLVWTVDAAATIKSVVQMTEIVVLIPLVFSTLPRDLDAVRLGLLCIVGASSILAVFATASAAPDLAHGSFSAVDLDYGLNKNVAGSYIGAGFVVAYVLLIAGREGKRSTRWLFTALAIETVGLAATLSRGTMIGVGAAIVAASLVLARRRAGSIAVTMLALAAFLRYVAPQIRDNVGSLAGAYSSDEVRVISFQHAIDKIKDRPLTGVGTGAYTDTIEELGIGLLPDPNNLFLLTWAEIGPAGIAALLFLLWRYLRSWVTSRRLPPDGAALTVAAGAVSLSLLVHFQFDVSWTRGTSSMAFAGMGLVVAVARIERSESAAR